MTDEQTYSDVSVLRTSAELAEFAAAFAEAQAEIGHATRDRENPFFNSSYADLASVKDACQPALSKHGIGVIQAPATHSDGSVTVLTRLLHKSGQWVEADMTAKAIADNKGNVTAQALGSVVTYLRRYMLSGMTNVATEDDDGEGAAGRTASNADKVTVAGKPAAKAPAPDKIDIPADRIIVEAEFWDRPDYGLAKQDGWKINDWLAHLRAHIDQAPNSDALNKLWQDNATKIDKLSDVRQLWCNEIFSGALVNLDPDITSAA